MNYTTLKGQLKALNFNQEANNKALYLALILPLACMIFLLEWEPRVLVFVFLGYSSGVIGFLLARTMIEKDRLLKEEDVLYRMMANHISDMVIIHRLEDNNNVFVSPSISELLGYAPDEIICKFGTYLIHPDDRRQMQRKMHPEALSRNPEFVLSLRVQKKNKTFIWMELAGKAILDDQGQPNYTILSFRDATARKEVEAATQRFAQELMRKHSESRSPQLPSEDLSALMCSHDLKEPLRTIKSYISLLDDKCKEQLDASGKECLHFIQDGANRMSDMIEDIQAFSKMGSASVRKRPTDLEGLLEEVLRALNARITATQAIITREALPVASIDARQFRHLLQNLIENGIKYAGDKQPQMHLSWEKKDGQWVFRLSDNGIGIPKAFQETIFALFHRLHGVGEISGSGIGLSICRKIVENHMGRIWVESEGHGQGSTFVFTLPFSEENRLEVGQLHQADVPSLRAMPSR
ncbi:MAG: ATP-binding protein [Bacteroidota bacterium]